MARYWIERREVGWRKYRVKCRALTLGAFVTGGTETKTTVEASFLTWRGARRYIDRITWTKVPDTPRPDSGATAPLGGDS